MAAPLPSDPKELQAYLAQLFSNPALLPANFLSYLNDYYAVNQLPVPASNIIGISSFLERLDQNTDTVQIVNSTTETTIYTYEVPADTLQKNGGIGFYLSTKWEQNSGSSSTLELKIKYGATTMVHLTSVALSSSTSPVAFPIQLYLFNKGAANAQEVAGSCIATRGGATTGYGALDGYAGAFGGSASEDSTQKKTFSVSAKLSLAHANNKFSKLFAFAFRASH